MAARQDIAAVMQSLKLYRLDNQRYPTTEQGLQALVSRPTTGPEAANWKPRPVRAPARTALGNAVGWSGSRRAAAWPMPGKP